MTWANLDELNKQHYQRVATRHSAHHWHICKLEAQEIVLIDKIYNNEIQGIKVPELKAELKRVQQALYKNIGGK